MPPPSSLGFLIRCGLLLTSILSLHLLPFPPVVAYTIVFLSSSAIYLWTARDILSVELPQRLLLTILLISLLVRLSFITTQPIASDDVYRYIWDGKIQASGINPYRYAPDAPELYRLHSALLPATVNHPDMKTVYFPVAQWIFFFAFQIGGEGIWSFKLMLLLAEIFTLMGLFLLTSQLRFPNTFTLLYALCPLPILQFGIDAHMDGLGLPFLVIALLLYARERRTLALFLIGLSMSIKPVALIFLPILLLLEKGMWARVKTMLVPTLLLAAQFIPYMLTSNPFEALMTFTKHWTFNGIIFETLNLFLSDNQLSRLACVALLGVALLALWISKKDLWNKIYFSILLLLLFSPVVHPWYVTWLGVLLPLVKRWSGIVFVATVSLTSFTILSYRLDGVWTQYPVALLLQYLPVVALLIRELTNPTLAKLPHSKTHTT